MAGGHLTHCAIFVITHLKNALGWCPFHSSSYVVLIISTRLHSLLPCLSHQCPPCEVSYVHNRLMSAGAWGSSADPSWKTYIPMSECLDRNPSPASNPSFLLTWMGRERYNPGYSLVCTVIHHSEHGGRHWLPFQGFLLSLMPLPAMAMR